MIDIRIPFNWAYNLVRQHLGAFWREDIVVLGVDHGELFVFGENAQRFRQIDGIIFSEFLVEFFLFLLVITGEEGEEVARFIGIGCENVRQASSADDHEATLDAAVDIGGVGRRESTEGDACGTQLGGIDFREGEQDVVEADDIGPHLFKSLEKSFFCSKNCEWAKQSAALSEIGHLEIGGDNAVFGEQLADFLFQLEFVRSDCVEDLDGWSLVVRLGVHRKIDFAEDGAIDGIVWRRDGRREADGESTEVFVFRKWRDFNIEYRSKGRFGNLARLGHGDG